MKQLHQIQRQILNKMLFADKLRFADLKPDELLENNQLNFHLKQLIRLKYVEKADDMYQLTKTGREYANRMDTDRAKVQKQAKISALCFCYRGSGADREYLLYTRLKQPFYGHQGWPSGKVAYGEMIADAAKRELKEETNLDGDPELFHVRHYHVIDSETGDMLEDKIFFYYRIRDPKGELMSNDEGEFQWVKESEIKEKITKPFESIENLLNEVELLKNFNGVVNFEEIEHVTEVF